MKRQPRKQNYRTDNLFVYETPNSTFSIEGVINKKRIRKRAKTLCEAKLKCHLLEEETQSMNVVRTTLNSEQVKDAELAFAKLPDNIQIAYVVEHFLKGFKATKVPTGDLVWKYLETKDGCSINTYKQAKVLLLKFGNWSNGLFINEVNSTGIKNYLRSVSLGSYNHHLRALKGFFLWSIREGYLESNPCNNLKLKQREHKDVAILSCDEARALLIAARNLYEGEMLPYAAITLFGGLRPDSEMRHLNWDSVNLEDSEIRVTIGKTKTPRTVGISENLLRWLRVCDRSRMIYPINFRGKWAAIRNAAGFKGGSANTKTKKATEAHFKPWIKDYTRHSAISYRVRKTGDINTTATWAGNSPAIIRKHYLGLVSGSAAEEYWNISPCSVDS
jgi:integrase